MFLVSPVYLSMLCQHALCSQVWNMKEKLTFVNLLDVGEIYSRLLDHRPVIQGEIRYFVKEFEVSVCVLLGLHAVLASF